MAQNGLICADVPLRNCSLTDYLLTYLLRVTEPLSRITIAIVFTAQRYAGTVYAVVVCLSVCLSIPSIDRSSGVRWVCC